MFQKYEIYETVQSVYCYKDTDVLKNKLNIRDKDELIRAEERITAVKLLSFLDNPIKGNFTKTHLCHIHRGIFGDIYAFAGHIRREQISKGDTMFYPPHLIGRELTKVFGKLHEERMLYETDRDKQICDLSYMMSQLNIIHPFREGNGRAVREMIRCMALRYGLTVEWGNTDRDTMIRAAIASVDDDMAFCDVIRGCISDLTV